MPPNADSKRMADYNASAHYTANHQYRAAFHDSDGHVYVAHFNNIAEIARFARNEFIYDVGVTVTFTVFNLDPR